MAQGRMDAVEGRRGTPPLRWCKTRLRGMGFALGPALTLFDRGGFDSPSDRPVAPDVSVSSVFPRLFNTDVAQDLAEPVI